MTVGELKKFLEGCKEDNLEIRINQTFRFCQECGTIHQASEEVSISSVDIGTDIKLDAYGVRRVIGKYLRIYTKERK